MPENTTIGDLTFNDDQIRDAKKVARIAKALNSPDMVRDSAVAMALGIGDLDIDAAYPIVQQFLAGAR